MKLYIIKKMNLIIREVDKMKIKIKMMLIPNKIVKKLTFISKKMNKMN